MSYLLRVSCMHTGGDDGAGKGKGSKKKEDEEVRMCFLSIARGPRKGGGGSAWVPLAGT